MSASSDHSVTFRKTYIAVLVTIAVSVLLGQGLVFFLTNHFSTDARLINIAGRQRMLSQRIASQSLQLADAAHRANADRVAQGTTDLLATLESWLAAHQNLIDRDSASGLSGENSPTVASDLEELRVEQEKTSRGVKAWLRSPALPRRGPRPATSFPR